MPARQPRFVARKRKRKQQRQAAAIPLLPPDTHEEDVEVSDEDIQFLAKHRRYVGFLSNLDTNAITKHVLGLSNECEENLENYYEKKAKWVQYHRDEDASLLSAEPADVLPVKTLTGELLYNKISMGKSNGTDASLKLNDCEVLVRKKKHEISSENMQRESRQYVDDCPPIGHVEHEVRIRKPADDGRIRKMGTDKLASKDGTTKNSSESSRLLVLEELKRDLSAEERVDEIKSQMAKLATAVLADPETNIQSLKELLDFCSDHDERIVNLAMLSLFVVFKDVAPGYHIRLPTPKELEMQVSKEVRKLRDYEGGFLLCYQKYVQMLINSVKSCIYGKSALRCLCGLLDFIPHFNYRDSVLVVVIQYTNSSDDVLSAMCCEAVRSVFKNEGKHRGEATVEAVQLIADLVRKHDCLLRPDTIQVFLSLSFDKDIHHSLPEDSKHGHDTKKSKYDDMRAHSLMLKQQNGKKVKKHQLAAKLREEVTADFKEASVLPDASERRVLQTMTLSAVFETYFRILKTSLHQCGRVNNPNVKENNSRLIFAKFGPWPLLRPCLDGLGKFSHLISVDFMGDLLAVLQKLAASTDVQDVPNNNQFRTSLTVSERLQCCIVAFSIVHSNLDALNLDLHDFYVHFYNLLMEYNPVREVNNAIVLAQALQVMLWEGRQHDMQRVAAFIKRLSSQSLHLGSAEVIAALVTARRLLQRYKKCQCILENDGIEGNASGGMTVCQAGASDPDLSGALSSVLWEITLLGVHYHPGVAKLASQISTMINSEDVFLASLSPKDAFISHSIDRGGFQPPVQPPRKLIKKQTYLHHHGLVLEENLKGIFMTDCDRLGSWDNESEGKFSLHFRVLKGIKENENLRGELRRISLSLKLYKEYVKTKSEGNKV